MPEVAAFSPNAEWNRSVNLSICSSAWSSAFGVFPRKARCEDCGPALPFSGRLWYFPTVINPGLGAAQNGMDHTSARRD